MESIEEVDEKQPCEEVSIWGEMYQRLLDFQKKNGHCRVPYRYKKDPKLGTWVSVQRRHYKLLKSGRRKKTSLTAERESQLDKIGFQWSCEVPWETYFQQLLEFVAINGHAQVPMKWEKDPKFSNWVSSQRREYKNLQMGRNASLNNHQIELLNGVGFVWQAERGGAKRIRDGSHVQAPDKMTSPMLKANAVNMLKAIRKSGFDAAAQKLNSATSARDAAVNEDHSRKINLGCNFERMRELQSSINAADLLEQQDNAARCEQVLSMLSGLNPLTKALLTMEQPMPKKSRILNPADIQQYAVAQVSAARRQSHAPSNAVSYNSQTNPLLALSEINNHQAQTNGILGGEPTGLTSFLNRRNPINLVSTQFHHHNANQKVAVPAAASEICLMLQSKALHETFQNITQQNDALAMLLKPHPSNTLHSQVKDNLSNNLFRRNNCI